MAAIRLARLKLQLLCEEYKQIAGSERQPDYNRASHRFELYLNNYVKKSDFNDEFADMKLQTIKLFMKARRQYNNRFLENPVKSGMRPKHSLKRSVQYLRSRPWKD